MSGWFEHFSFSEVAENLVMGAYPQDAEDVAALRADGITRVFNVVQDVEYDPGARDACSAALAEAGMKERRLELVDYGSLPAPQIEEAAQAVVAWLDAGERVYVHCRAGWQRSAVIVAAFLVLRESMTPRQALAVMRERRPQADPLPHQRADLLDWWRGRDG